MAGGDNRTITNKSNTVTNPVTPTTATSGALITNTPSINPPPPAPLAPPAPVAGAPNTQVVPGTATAGTGQMNVTDYAAQIVNDPSKGIAKDNPATPNVNESGSLADHVPAINPNTAGTNVTAPQPTGTAPKATTTQATATTAAQVDPRTANTYQSVDSLGNVIANGQAIGVQGTVACVVVAFGAVPVG